jgi:cytochrome c-type biogenesis protein CcmI
MTVLILGLLLWPLLKRTAAAATGEQEKTLSIFRQQFVELGQDLANGVLTDELYQQARRELERRLLEETGATETTPTIAPRQVSSRPVALALAIIIPTVSGLLYWELGNPLAMTQPTAAQLAAQGSSEDAHPTADSLDALIEQLKQKMEQNPNDGVGWVLLARSYVGMGRYPDAVPIFEKAVKLIPDDAQALRTLIVEAATTSNIIITTGGTGIGPRDITIETIQPLLTKEITGIMDFIRLKYGADKPNALLSRSIAGIIGQSLIYTLPGSVRAVEEYMNEILKTLKHTIYMQYGVDKHS